MIELNHVDLMQGAASLDFAGDILNTSIYLSRLGCDLSDLTNLGTDAFSMQRLRRFEAEGINCGLIGQHETCLPGVYAIETDHSDERSFRKWRDASAARTLFSGVAASLADLAEVDVIYLSGFTLTILRPDVRADLIAATKQL